MPRAVAALRFPDGTSQATAATSSGGGGGTVVGTVEIDFGTVAKRQVTLTFNDAALATSQQLVITQSGEAATGRQADENEMETFMVNGRVSAAGVATINVRALRDSMLQGKFRLNYTAG